MPEITKVVLDAMGGDNAPFEIVKGVSIAAAENKDVELVLIGDTKLIDECFVKIEVAKPDNVTIVHTDVVVTMEDDPMVVMKEKNNSSMALGSWVMMASL